MQSVLRLYNRDQHKDGSREHVKMIEAKAFRTFIRIYFLFKSEHLSANIKLTLHRAMIRSVITYACHAQELVADTYLLKLQSLQNKFSELLKIFQGAHQSTISTQLSTFHTYI
jgi:hypothetical protein